MAHRHSVRDAPAQAPDIAMPRKHSIQMNGHAGQTAGRMGVYAIRYHASIGPKRRVTTQEGSRSREPTAMRVPVTEF